MLRCHVTALIAAAGIAGSAPAMVFAAEDSASPARWCATSAENDVRVRQSHERAIARLAAAGKTITTATADIRQRYGLLILEDVDNEVLNFKQPFDLVGQTLRFTRTGDCCFDAMRESLQFDADVGPLAATWDDAWGQEELALPFSFPFGNRVYTTMYATSDIGVFFLPQSQGGSSSQHLSVDFFDPSARITPLLRDGVWIWPRNVDLHVKMDADSVTLTWHQRPPRTDSIHGIDQRFQATLTSSGEITFSYPDSFNWNTFGLVQVVAPGTVSPMAAFDFSALTESPTSVEGFIGEPFTLPEFSPQTARDIIQARFGELVDDVDLFVFYQNFYTDIVFYAGGYHSGNVLHMNEINLSWNSRDHTSVSVLQHEVGHDWLYFGLPSGTGAHPKQGANTPAAFAVHTPFDGSAMGGTFWLDNADGTFTTLPYRTYYGFSWHELYLMGLATRAEATDWWYLSGVPGLDAPYYPPTSSTFAATRNDLAADVLDVVDPEYPNAQTDFNILFTLITRPENPVRDEDLANVRRKMEVWPNAWSDSTGGRSTLRVYFGELLPNGDFDFDGDVDMRDFGEFQECFAGAGTPTAIGPCRAGDFDGDTDADLDDFTQWDALFSAECAEPAFVVQPVNAFGCEGHPVTFTATVDNADSLRWRRGGIDIAGATTATLEIDPVTSADAGTYSLIAENACGAVMSATATLKTTEGPQVVLHPNEVTMCPGTEATFTVSVEAAGSYTVAWTRDGFAIPGATGSSYAVASAGPADAGAYTAVVTDACGTTESNMLIATLSPPCGGLP